MSIRRMAALWADRRLDPRRVHDGGARRPRHLRRPALLRPANLPRARPAARPRPDCKVGVSWNNYKEERWAKWDEPTIKAAVEAAGGDVHRERREFVRRDAGDQRRATSSPRARRSSSSWPQDGTAIQPSVAERDRARHPGHRLRPPDRGSETSSTSPSTTRASDSCMAEEIIKVVPEGQLRDHQGQRGRRELRLPAVGHRGGHRRRGARPATSRSSARPTPTTGSRASRRPTWSSSSPRGQQDRRGPRRATTAWPAASSRRSRPRASLARSPSRARTATRPP